MNKNEIIEELKQVEDKSELVYIYDCEEAERIPVCEVWTAVTGNIQIDDVTNGKALMVCELIEELENMDNYEVFYGNVPVTLVDLSIEGAVDLNINEG